MSRFQVLALLLCLLTLGAFAWGLDINAHGGDPFKSATFQLTIVASAVVYLFACIAVLRPGPKPSMWLILGVATLLRVALVAGPPLLSSDVYRYVWDGRVQNAGVNPFLYVPVDPALAPLRDTAIYPHINRATYAHTIYPPAAQAFFAVVTALSDSVIAMKLAMVAMECLAIICVLRLLARAGRPLAQVLIYAWNPLALWEFAENGHVDAMALGLVALAIMLRAGGQRDGWAGVVAGAAVLVKFLPAVVIPALWRRGPGGGKLVVGGAACILALYGFYFVFGHAGAKVIGFLNSYGSEEGLDTGSGIWALAGLGLLSDLPAWATKLYLAMTAVILLALGSWIAFRPRPTAGSCDDVVRVCSDAGILATTLMLLVTPHYAWYFAWLAVPAVIAPYSSVIWLSVSPLLLYYNPFPDHFLWQALVFAPALVLAWRDLRSARATAPVPALQGSF